MNRSDIEAERKDILEQLQMIRSAHPGCVSEQMLRGTRQSKPVQRGPYFLLQWCEDGTPRRRRLCGEEEVRHAKEDTENSRRIDALIGRFKRLTQQLGELERNEEAAAERQKKGLLSKKRRARK